MTDEMHLSLAELDRAEREMAAAIELGRHLLADPDASLPAYEVRVHHRRDRVGLRIWAAYQDPAGVETWAQLLGAAVKVSPYEPEPTQVHHTVDGELDGVPLHVWTIITLPITKARSEFVDARWRVRYVQGEGFRTIWMPDRAAARAWIKQWATAAPQDVDAAEPITSAMAFGNSKSWRVVYRQGGVRKSLPQPSKAAARAWIAENGPKRVPA